RPGSLVRLELPAVVYGAARADLGNLRVAAGERQIPFFRWSPAAPALADREPSLHPVAGGERSRESEVEIHLPEPGLPHRAGPGRSGRAAAAHVGSALPGAGPPR